MEAPVEGGCLFVRCSEEVRKVILAATMCSKMRVNRKSCLETLGDLEILGARDAQVTRE